jgi:hypothetical protein
MEMVKWRDMTILKDISLTVRRLEKQASTNNTVFRSTAPYKKEPPIQVKPKPPWQQGHPGYDPTATDPQGYQWNSSGKVIPQMTSASVKNDRMGSSLRAPRRHGWGIYASLGNEKLQDTIDTGAKIMSQKGGVPGKIMAGLTKGPDYLLAGAGATALGATVAPYAAAHPLTSGAVVGATTGVQKGIETGSVSQGIATGLNNAATTTALLGGNMMAAGILGSGGAASETIANGGSVGDAARNAGMAAGMYGVFGLAGRAVNGLANKTPFPRLFKSIVHGGVVAEPVVSSYIDMQKAKNRRDQARQEWESLQQKHREAEDRKKLQSEEFRTLVNKITSAGPVSKEKLNKMLSELHAHPEFKNMDNETYNALVEKARPYVSQQASDWMDFVNPLP